MHVLCAPWGTHRLLCGVPGDISRLPNSQRTLLSATTRVTLMKRRWQLPMIGGFLDSSVPEAK